MNPRSLTSALRRAARLAQPTLSAWTCSECGSDAVGVVDGQPRGGGRLLLVLRCGECGQWREAVMSRPMADRFRDHLRRGMASIEDDVRRLSTPGFTLPI
jgi:hypothetical protein